MTDLEQARSLVRSGDFETLNLLYEKRARRLVRAHPHGRFVPERRMQVYRGDFSSIEAVVLAVACGRKKWTLETMLRSVTSTSKTPR